MQASDFDGKFTWMILSIFALIIVGAIALIIGLVLNIGKFGSEGLTKTNDSQQINKEKKDDTAFKSILIIGGFLIFVLFMFSGWGEKVYNFISTL